MRIAGPSPIAPPLPAMPAASVETFLPDVARTPAPRQTTATALAAPTSMAVLVALAGTEAASERRRKLAAGTDRGLALLERLRDEMALGSASPEALGALANWSAGFDAPDEPELAGIAKEVELRALVELAKRETA